MDIPLKNRPTAVIEAPRSFDPNRRHPQSTWWENVRLSIGALCTRIERLEARDMEARDGRDGRDGVGILSAEIDGCGMLVLRLSNGAEHRVGLVGGPPGLRGEKGEPGAPGKRGAAGRDGVIPASVDLSPCGSRSWS
jgi:hypothetical protein